MGDRTKKEIYLKEIGEIKQNLHPKVIKKLKINLLERIIKRLEDYSQTCDKCKQDFDSLEDFIKKIGEGAGYLESNAFRVYRLKIKNIIAHLEKKHGLINEGHYMSQYMIYGMVLGTGVGAALGNVALGPAFGLCIGIVIGSLLDHNAKKKGHVI